jgi:hypothetical protein
MNYDKIDYGIKGFVRELNRKGFETLFSCAGHFGEDFRAGYVTIKGCRDLDQLKEIAIKYVKSPRARLSRLSWNMDDCHQTMRVTDLTFKSKNLTRSLGWDGEQA